jgi:anti-anti-sigma factor
MAISHPGEETRDDTGPFPGSLSLVIVRRPEEVVCHARGSMDRAHAAMLERRLGDLAREPLARLVIDLADVEYVGPSGVIALLSVRAIGEERGRAVVIRNAPDHAADALATAGLLDRV